MRVFVTGGSGFVGGHVIEDLVGAHEVRAMARSDRSAEKVEAFGAVAVRCSLEDIGPEHLKGVDAIVHAAAYVEEYGPESAYFDANVGGTQRLLDAAREAGVSRFVLVSTNATVFDGKGQLQVDEQAAYTELGPFPYGRSKAEAERRVLAANDGSLTTVAVRPCFVWGPRDNSVLPALKRMADEGSFVWLDGGRAKVSTTHVDNLVHAVVRGLEAAPERVGGEAFFVTDEDDTDLRAFLTALATANGFALPGRSMPSWLVRTIAAGLAGLWAVMGRTTPPPVTRMAALLMSSDMTVQTTKARARLGWKPVVGRQEALAKMAA